MASNQNGGAVATDWRVHIDRLHQDATAISELSDVMQTDEGRTHCERTAEDLRSRAKFMEQTVQLVGGWKEWE